jgi:hypothetical protein
VSDAIILVYHLNHFVVAEKTEIEGLAAGRRIERCPVQVNSPAVGGYIHDLCLKFSQIGVGVVEPFGCHF